MLCWRRRCDEAAEKTAAVVTERLHVSQGLKAGDTSVVSCSFTASVIAEDQWSNMEVHCKMCLSQAAGVSDFEQDQLVSGVQEVKTACGAVFSFSFFRDSQFPLKQDVAVGEKTD